MQHSFESALKRLEEIVGLLEKGELSLEESLKLFEEGVSLVQFCSSQLNDAEKRMKVLLKTSEGFEVQPMDVDG